MEFFQLEMGILNFFFFFEKPDWKFGIAWALLIKPQ